jgi:hypothetical protein
MADRQEVKIKTLTRLTTLIVLELFLISDFSLPHFQIITPSNAHALVPALRLDKSLAAKAGADITAEIVIVAVAEGLKANRERDDPIAAVYSVLAGQWADKGITFGIKKVSKEKYTVTINTNLALVTYTITLTEGEPSIAKTPAAQVADAGAMGPIKAVVDPTDEDRGIDFTALKKRHIEFELLARDVTPVHKTGIRKLVKVVFADLKGEMAEYHFESGGIYIIVVNNSWPKTITNSEKIQEEAEYHGEREIYWMQRQYPGQDRTFSAREAHIIAWQEQAKIFSNYPDGLTEYQWKQLYSKGMDIKALAALIEENRAYQHSVLKAAIKAGAKIKMADVETFEAEFIQIALGREIGILRDAISYLIIQQIDKPADTSFLAEVRSLENKVKYLSDEYKTKTPQEVQALFMAYQAEFELINLLIGLEEEFDSIKRIDLQDTAIIEERTQGLQERIQQEYEPARQRYYVAAMRAFLEPFIKLQYGFTIEQLEKRRQVEALEAFRGVVEKLRKDIETPPDNPAEFEEMLMKTVDSLNGLTEQYGDDAGKIISNFMSRFGEIILQQHYGIRPQYHQIGENGKMNYKLAILVDPGIQAGTLIQRNALVDRGHLAAGALFKIVAENVQTQLENAANSISGQKVVLVMSANTLASTADLKNVILQLGQDNKPVGQLVIRGVPQGYDGETYAGHVREIFELAEDLEIQVVTSEKGLTNITTLGDIQGISRTEEGAQEIILTDALDDASAGRLQAELQGAVGSDMFVIIRQQIQQEPFFLSIALNKISSGNNVITFSSTDARDIFTADDIEIFRAFQKSI